MIRQIDPILTCDLCGKSHLDEMATVYSSRGFAEVKPSEFVGNLRVLAELCHGCWNKLNEFLDGRVV